jgi:hypothetical protein
MVRAAEMLVPQLNSGSAANNANNNVASAPVGSESATTPTTPKSPRLDLKTTTIVMSKHTLGPHTSTVSTAAVLYTVYFTCTNFNFHYDFYLWLDF